MKDCDKHYFLQIYGNPLKGASSLHTPSFSIIFWKISCGIGCDFSGRKNFTCCETSMTFSSFLGAINYIASCAALGGSPVISLFTKYWIFWTVVVFSTIWWIIPRVPWNCLLRNEIIASKTNPVCKMRGPLLFNLFRQMCQTIDPRREG